MQVKPIYSIRTLVMTALRAWVTLTAGLAVADESTEQFAIPDTPATIWQSIDNQVKALDGLLASGELEEVHYHAFAVRDLVRALPEHSQGLGPEPLEQVKANVGYVGRRLPRGWTRRVTPTILWAQKQIWRSSRKAGLFN